jgi:glycosyltransferase involved in cell wall biosynthesis
MRVTFLAIGLNLWSGGGSNFSLDLTLTELHRRGVDVELLVLRDGGLQGPDDRPYPAHELGWHLKTQFETMLRVRRLLEERAIGSDIYHLYSPQLIYGGGRYRARGGTVPVVVTLNDYQPFCSTIDLMDGDCPRGCSLGRHFLRSERPFPRKILGALGALYWRTRGRGYVPAIDRLLPDSECVRALYAGAGFDMTRSTVLPEVIDSGRIRAVGVDRRRHGVPDGGDWRIAYVGRLIRAKGVDLLLEAAARLRPRIGLRLDIAGDGPERGALERQAGRLGLADRVTFHGWLLQEPLRAVYERADLFVHPGRWPEPFGRTIVEAMTLGLPTIVSDVGHPPSLLGEAGLSFRPGDSHDLARAISTAIENYDRRGPAAYAARSQAERYSPTAVIDHLQEVYRGVLQGAI